jgi:hypothetical protein
VLHRDRQRPSKRCGRRRGSPGPGTGPRQGAGPSAPPPHRRGGPTSTRSWLKRASLKPNSRRSTAWCDCFEPPSLGKPPRTANARVSWAGKPASASTLTSTSTTCPCERARSSLPLRCCYGPCRPLITQGAEPAPRGASTHRASGRSTGRKLGVPHPPAGERAGRRWCARPRTIGARGRRSGKSHQPRAHAGQGADP